MAAGEIITRLILKTDDFDRNIGRSRKRVGEFERAAKEFGQKFAGAFRTVAASAGVGLSAVEAFKKTISSSDSLSDKYKGTMLGLNTAVNSFFEVISTGNFANFNQGLESSVKKARELITALKDFSNMSMGFSFLSTKADARYQEIITDLRSGQVQGKEREGMITEARGLLAQRETRTDSLTAKALESVKSALSARSDISSGQIALSDIESVFSDYLENGTSTYQTRYREYSEKLQRINDRYMSATDYGGGRVSVTDTRKTGRDASANMARYQEEKRVLSESYIREIVANAIFENTSAQNEFTQALQSYSSSYSMKLQTESQQKALNRIIKGAEGTGTAEAKAPTVYAAGSLAEYRRQIQTLNKELDETPDQSVRVAVSAKIAELEQVVRQIQNAVSRAGKPDLEPLKQVSPITAKAEPLEKSGLALPEKQDKNGTLELDADFTDAIEGVGELTSVFSMFGQVCDDNTAKWLNYISSLAAGVAKAIPLIFSSRIAQEQEGQAAGKSAAMKAGNAVAGVPIVGPILAVAAIASVVAALMSIPKFAEGGIVGGNSYYGDKLLARVNSGEVILNQRQQESLYSQLGRTDNVRITGELTAKGRDLALILEKNAVFKRL